MIESPPKLDKRTISKIALIMDNPEVEKLIGEINQDYLYWSDVKYKSAKQVFSLPSDRKIRLAGTCQQRFSEQNPGK